MEDLGFSFIRPVGWLCDPRTGEMLQMDALFARNATRDRPVPSSGDPGPSLARQVAPLC